MQELSSRTSAAYVLPISPAHRVLDRFSILPDSAEGEDGLAPLWDLLVAIVSRPVSTLKNVVDVLEDIAFSLRGSTGQAGDFAFLVQMLSSPSTAEVLQEDFVQSTWPRIVSYALAMPCLFPTAQIPLLVPGNTLVLSRRQVACLVAHQFLCSLPVPPHRAESDAWVDFGIWYGSEQVHPVAAGMYISALCSYFSSLPELDEAEGSLEGGVRYALHSPSPPLLQRLSDLNTPLSPATAVRQDTYTTEPQILAYLGPKGGVVVSANRVIGFGKSATQEEIYVGNAPESAPAVLFTPILRDSEVLRIDGARPMLRISGERRSVSWKPRREEGGVMLFMDALELDEAADGEVLPDLQGDNIRRELIKAATAFSTLSPGGDVWTPLWGCGAFCGNPGIKLPILWLAASVANVNLNVLVAGDEMVEAFEAFVSRWSGRTAAVLRRRLEGLAARIRDDQVGVTGPEILRLI